jgi:beta-mannosidase
MLTRFTIPFIFVVMLLLIGCTKLPRVQQELFSQPLNTGWEFYHDPDGQADPLTTMKMRDGWQPIQVPANWHLGFTKGHDISGTGWYRHQFNTPSMASGKRAWLRFCGVDYIADVWLNGQFIGHHEGYFQPFGFEVTKYLVMGGSNQLLVRVESPLEDQSQGTEWSLHKRLIKGIFSHHDTRPGGAWSERGQEQNTGGIWAPVVLEFSGPVTVERVAVVPRVDSETLRAQATVKLDLNSASAQRITLETELKPYNFFDMSVVTYRENVAVSPGKNQILLTIPEDTYRLWEVWERGKPHLYRYRVSIRDSAGKLSTVHDSIFGFRSVRRDPESGLWFLNGRRIFLRGTNYIATQWLSEMTPKSYARDLRMMRDANINAVRVHAHVTGGDFYHQADAAGMLVWQDFPLQWGYVDTPEFVEEARRQLRDMLNTLYNHPSIFAWSLHNEPPWDASWMKWKYKGYNKEQNRILDDALFAELQSFNDGRYKHLASTTNEHPWFGWYSGHWRDYGKATKSSLVTEYGAQALPDLDSMRKILNDNELWPDNDAEWAKWSYHNFQKHENFDNAKVSMGTDIHQFIANTQGYQARLIDFAAESYRRQRYAPVGAIFQFMFVENWPSMNWGVVDYWRNPKSGYFALQRAYQPLLPGIEWKKDEFVVGETMEAGLWVINDLMQCFPEITLHYRLLQEEATLSSHMVPLNINADSAIQVETLKHYDLKPGHYKLQAWITDSNGRKISKNCYIFNVVEKRQTEGGK